MNEFMDCEAWPVGAPFLGIPGKYVTFENGVTAEDKSREFVTDKDYGSIGDGLYHPLSEKYTSLDLAKFAYANIAEKITSLDQSIDWAALQSAIKDNACVYIDDSCRVITNSLAVPDGHGIIGRFKLKQTPQNTPESNKGVLLFYGTGTRDNIAPTLGDEVYQVANPNIGDAYLADSGTRGNTYKLRNFNEMFSAAVKLGSGSYLERISVLPYHADGTTDGTTGYRGSSTACADEWDVGIWCANVVNWSIRDVWAKGQWRKAGLLISASKINDGKTTVANDCWIVQNSSFGGGVGLSIRADNANPAGFTNYGFGNGSFINCQFYGFQHQSAHLATSSILAKPLDRPSGCFEISGNGNVPRGIDFITCTFLTREDINIFAGRSSEIKFIGCYQESKTAKVNNVWDVAALGSRMVVSSDSNLQFIGHSKYGIDFSPNMTRENSIARYGSVAGVCSSNAILADDDYENFKYIGSTGVRLRRTSGLWGVADYQNNVIFSVDGDGDVVAKKSITAGGVLYFNGGLENTVPGGATAFKRSNSAGVMDTYMWASGTNLNVTFHGDIITNTDNAQTLGSAGSRWSTVHLGTAPIVTSDEHLKQQFRSQTQREKDAALEIKNSICLYKLNDAVDLKGDGARWHVGVKAQQVVSILESHDLNPFDYGFVCYDEWEESETGPAGSQYAIRYDELTMFILSAM